MNNNQNRCGCGGQPTVMDIDRETKENTNFRKEAWTGEHLQVTLMCIPTNCDIGAVQSCKKIPAQSVEIFFMPIHCYYK